MLAVCLALAGRAPDAHAATVVEAEVSEARLGEVLVRARFALPSALVSGGTLSKTIGDYVKLSRRSHRLVLDVQPGVELRLRDPGGERLSSGPRSVDLGPALLLEPSPPQCQLSSGLLECHWTAEARFPWRLAALSIARYQADSDGDGRAAAARLDDARRRRSELARELTEASGDLAEAQARVQRAWDEVEARRTELASCRQDLEARGQPWDPPSRGAGHNSPEAPAPGFAGEAPSGSGEVPGSASATVDGDAPRDLEVSLELRRYAPRLGRPLLTVTLRPGGGGAFAEGEVPWLEEYLVFNRARARGRVVVAPGAEVWLVKETGLRVLVTSGDGVSLDLGELYALAPSFRRCHRGGGAVECTFTAVPALGLARAARDFEALQSRVDEHVAALSAEAAREEASASVLASRVDSAAAHARRTAIDVEEARREGTLADEALAACRQTLDTSLRVLAAEREAERARREAEGREQARRQEEQGDMDKGNQQEEADDENEEEKPANSADAVLVLAPGVERRQLDHRGARWTVVRIDARQATIDLVGGEGGLGLRQAIKRLESGGRRAVAATNAGMFEADGSPVGLFIADGTLQKAIVTEGATGNFGMLPNGVFWIDGRGAHVSATEDWPGPRGVRLATQSGPLLLDGGRIHPKFNADSPNLNIRNGVGVDERGYVYLVISDDPARFHDMATLFRDKLSCPDALYLDGAVSQFWTRGQAASGGAQKFSGVLVVSVPE